MGCLAVWQKGANVLEELAASIFRIDSEGGSTWHYIPEDNLHTQGGENLRYHSQRQFLPNISSQFYQLRNRKFKDQNVRSSPVRVLNDGGEETLTQ
jgi:hypothetical protein